METEKYATESQNFQNLGTAHTNFSANQTLNGNKAALLNNNSRIGPAMSLQVIPGDVIDIEVHGYYEGGSGYSNTTALNGFAAAVASAFGETNGGSSESQSIFDGVNDFFTGLGSLNGTSSDNVPAAYLNYILVNQDYEDVASGYVQMSSAANFNPELLSLNNITVTKAGFLYVYVSLESNVSQGVFFDDLKVTHGHSMVVQKDDYYPFGVVFNSYTSGTENLYKFNGKEEQKETGLIDFGARMYDPCLGRWNHVDALAETYYGVSPYNFGLNNPISFIDPDGNFTIGVHSSLTKSALKKFGYSGSTRDLMGHYASVYADKPNGLIRFFSAMSKRDGIDYSATSNSQDTSSPIESTRHSMEGDHEDIGNSAAMIRGQKFGWKKIFEAAKEGTIDSYTENSKGAKAFGVGLHALQDSKVHKGVKFANHDHLADLGNNQAEGQAASITESAIIVTEVLNGDYSNLSAGSTLDVSGMGSKELKSLINSVMKSNVEKVTLMNYHQKPEDSAETGSGQIIN